MHRLPNVIIVIFLSLFLSLPSLAKKSKSSGRFSGSRTSTRSITKLSGKPGRNSRLKATRGSAGLKTVPAKLKSGRKGRFAAASSTQTRLSRKERLRLARANRVRYGRFSSRLRSRHGSWRPVHRYINPWDSPNYADSTEGDVIEGEDPAIREAAVAALGPLNGSVVVADANSGLVLSMVNQKLALGHGYIPCSTVKVVAAMAGLMEGYIDQTTPVSLSRRYSLNLTTALARSNNPYFATVGRWLGYDKVSYYARLFGLGEKAGFNIPGETAGTVASEEPASGIGMMTSFGDGINMTPLQLAGVMSTVANGGTLYYFQHPRNVAERDAFQPRVKRTLNLEPVLGHIRPGLQGAVDYGSGRRAYTAISSGATDAIYGKTGTCTHHDSRTHMGWFGSYSRVNGRNLVAVVMLTGGGAVSGPVASGVAGRFYQNLGKSDAVTSALLKSADLPDSDEDEPETATSQNR
jgi:penicillin-binding protein 2